MSEFIGKVLMVVAITCITLIGLSMTAVVVRGAYEIVVKG